MLFELLLGATAHGPISADRAVDAEGTDIVSFVEEFEGTVSSVLIGAWPETVSESMWCLAERCMEGSKKRPTSTEVCLANYCVPVPTNTVLFIYRFIKL